MNQRMLVRAHYNEDDFGMCFCEREERNDGKKRKRFIDGLGKWNGNNAHNENKKERNSSRQEIL